MFAGGLTTVAIGSGATDFLDAVALGDAATNLDDSTLQGLLNANAVSIAAIGPAMALTAFAAAVVIWSTSVLWRWLAPLAALSGLLHLVGALYVVPNDGGPLFFVRFAGLLTFACSCCSPRSTSSKDRASTSTSHRLAEGSSCGRRPMARPLRLGGVAPGGAPRASDAW